MKNKLVGVSILLAMLAASILPVRAPSSNPVELSYDDGTVDAWGFGSSAPGIHFQYVTRFHSPWEHSNLLEAKFYIMDTVLGANTLGYSADLIVMDNNRVTIFLSEVLFDQGGWFTVDLRPYAIVVPKDFYIGLEITHDVQDIYGDYVGAPAVGEDRIEAGMPEESWYVRFFEPGMLGYDLHGPIWWDGPSSYYNHMVRAVVNECVFSVIPEMPFGTVMAFMSMLIALVGFAELKRFRAKL